MASPLRWAMRSVGAKLVLPVSVIVAVVLLLFLGATYEQVHDLTIDTAGDRIERAALELAAAAELSVQARFEALRRLADLDELRRFAAARSGGALPAPLVDVFAADPSVLAFVILDAQGDKLAEAGSGLQAGPWLTPFEPADVVQTAAPDVAPVAEFYQVAPLRAAGDLLYYDAWVALHREGRVIGFLGQRREIELSENTRELANSLIGLNEESATINYGSGQVWTDLARLVPPPRSLAYFTPPDEPALEPVPQRVRYDPVGAGPRFAAIASIRQTPWLFVVERAEAAVLGPVIGMATRLGGFALLLVVVGAFGALLISRGVTRPADRIIDATRSLDDFEELPDIRRGDEFGRLAASFHRMREEVLAARARLEEEIRARTAELEATVSELETTRDELVRRERMNMLAQLTAAVSHEFRNCLAVIRNAEFVIAQRERGRSPQIDKQFDMLDRQIDLCEDIIRKLLDLGPAQSPARQRVRLAVLIDEQLARVEAPRGIEVVRSPAHEQVEVDVDPLQVGQALFNLFTNAVQAMGDEGSLALTTRPRPDGMVELEVSDTGPGIPEADEERVFEPLYTTKAEGTGLGLSVSRALVRANGGEITVRNEQGAVFRLLLPGAEPGQEYAETDQRAESEATGGEAADPGGR